MPGSSAPEVSFIVLCYNYGRFLRDCLTSILEQQDSVDFEILVVDDGSTDETPDVARTFAGPRLRVLRHATNLGHAAAITHALEQARGNLVARIDADDRYRPCFLDATLERFRTRPDVGLVYGAAAFIDERGTVTAEPGARPHRGDSTGNIFVRLLEENFICAPTVIARAAAWRAVAPVPTGLAFHDWYFALMIARRYTCSYVDRVVAEYRVHGANHHSIVVRDRKEEPSVLWLLDRIFSECEPLPQLEQQKRRARHRIYGSQYLALADKYFGFQMDADARRCYLRALAYRPELIFRPATLRRLAGTLAGRTRYERAKTLASAILHTARR